VGDKITVKVIRGEQTLTLNATLKARPEYLRN
jgi:S1-C subfamily serine protease